MSKTRSLFELVAVVVVVVGGILFLVTSSAWMARKAVKSVPPSVDKATGKAGWAQMRLGGKECTSAASKNYLEAIMKPLLAQTDSEFDFEYMVVDDESVNAFALPGGFLMIHYGLIQKAESGEEIAGVMAHEISHATLRHSVELILRQLGRKVLVSFVFGFGDVSALIDYGSAITELKYQRSQETAADENGHRILKKAGISPLGMAQFFSRLKKDELHVPELISTHPGSAKRSENAQKAAEGFTPTLNLPSPKGVPCHN